MSIIEYIAYLFFLKHFDEIELYNKCFSINRLLVNVERNDVDNIANRYNFIKNLLICPKKLKYRTSEFIERIKIPSIKNWNIEENLMVQKEVHIIDLVIEHTLRPGDILGQFLMSSFREKKFTLLSNSDAILGVIYERNFSLIFPHLMDKKKFSFNNYEIIKKLNPNSFKIKLSHLLHLETCKNGYNLLSKDIDFEQLYFIKRGEFLINMDITIESALMLFHEEEPIIDKILLKYINTNIGN